MVNGQQGIINDEGGSGGRLCHLMILYSLLMIDYSSNALLTLRDSEVLATA